MPKVDFKEKRVLIVDDQRPFLLMLKGIIAKLGVRSVRIVQSAEGAISDCKREKFDIVIADLHLGNNKKNGYQFIEEVRIHKLAKADTIFVMVSGDSHRPIVLGSIERNPDDYIIKPFSQAQLVNRMSKASEKKQVLKPIFVEIHKNDWESAINACHEVAKTTNKYKQACTLLLTELYWRTQEYEKALEIINTVLEQKPLPWAQVALAKTKLFMNEYDEAAAIAKAVIAARLLALEGHDILANCYINMNRFPDALQQIRLSIDLSPYSIERQYLGAAIGRLNGDFEFAKQCCKELFEQSKRSVHRDLSHMCNFVRAIIDIAENTDDKGIKNKYQQEAMLTLQRLRHDDVVVRSTEDFSYDAFSNLMTGRIHSLDSKTIEAKHSLTAAQEEIERRFDEPPMVLAADTIKLMVNLGEYGAAKKMANELRDSEHGKDQNVEYMLEQVDKTIEAQSGKFDHYNKRGLDCFNGGKYMAAFEAFSQALKYSQVNAGVALNLLHSTVRLLEQTTKPDVSTILECKKTVKLLEELPLNETQQNEFENIKGELSHYMELK